MSSLKGNISHTCPYSLLRAFLKLFQLLQMEKDTRKLHYSFLQISLMYLDFRYSALDPLFQ